MILPDAEEIEGVIRRRWDRTTREVIEYDPAGVEVSRRPFDAEEAVAAAERDAADLARAERVAARVAVRAIITDLQAERTRAQEVIDAAASTQEDRKNARAILRTAGACIDLARLVRDL